MNEKPCPTCGRQAGKVAYVTAYTIVFIILGMLAALAFIGVVAAGKAVL